MFNMYSCMSSLFVVPQVGSLAMKIILGHSSSFVLFVFRKMVRQQLPELRAGWLKVASYVLVGRAWSCSGAN